MDPNLIARILQMARMRQAAQQGAPGAQMGGMPGPSPLRGFQPPPGQDMPLAVGSGAAPQAPPDPSGMYGGAPGGLTPKPGGINPMFLPNQGAEQALASAGQGQAPMNPIVKQLMQHLGILQMMRNRSAQPFMAQTQGY